MTMSRDNRELLRIGLVGVGPGSTLSDRILLALLDDLDAADRERNDLIARYETQLVELARKAYDQRDAALEVLREIEWGSDVSHPRECPSCGGSQPEGGRSIGYGHFEDCKLASALGVEVHPDP